MFTSARLRAAAAGSIAFTVTPLAQTTSPIDQLTWMARAAGVRMPVGA